MKIIFYDTNKLYGAYRYFLLHQNLSEKSILKKICLIHEVYISTFVAKELNRIMPLSPDVDMVKSFCKHTKINIITSWDIAPTMDTYVNDPFDVQILQDAINIYADILLTDNLKDFKINEISEQFWLIVTNMLPQL